MIVLLCAVAFADDAPQKQSPVLQQAEIVAVKASALALYLEDKNQAEGLGLCLPVDWSLPAMDDYKREHRTLIPPCALNCSCTSMDPIAGVQDTSEQDEEDSPQGTE